MLPPNVAATPLPPPMYHPYLMHFQQPPPVALYLDPGYPIQQPEVIFGSRQVPDTPDPRAKDPTLFPLLKNWHHKLDASETHGADGQQFTQYTLNFKSRKIISSAYPTLQTWTLSHKMISLQSVPA